MARTSDADRILTLLAASPQGLSNQRIKNELNLRDERYDAVKQELLEAGEVEKYVCRGGGIRLTAKGDVAAKPQVEAEAKKATSSVKKEENLYPFLIDALLREAPDDVVFNTGSLRKRGKWQNPDVTQVSVEVYRRLRKKNIVITTYEVKQWGRWDVTAVFEAASHARFAHETWVVLEWPASAGPLVVPDPRVDQLLRECQRFGVGLATLQPHYTKYRLYEYLEPDPRAPGDAEVENWLEYALSRNKAAASRFDDMLQKADEGIKNGMPG